VALLAVLQDEWTRVFKAVLVARGWDESQIREAADDVLADTDFLPPVLP